jgi:ribose transport system substrate-binding protein
MKLRTRNLIAVLLVIALIGVSSISFGAARKVKKDKNIYVVFSQYSLLSPFFVASSYGFMKEIERMGIKGSIMDGGNVLKRQTEMIDDAITRGADAVVITPMDSDALTNAVKKLNRKNIPVITIDRSITGGKCTVLQSDNVEAGRKVAREFVKQIKKRGLKEVKLLQIRGQLGSSPSRDRDKGFWEVMKLNPDIKIKLVASSACDWDSKPAMEATQAHLTAHPEINAIFYEADCMMPGIVSAMKQLNRYVPQRNAKHIINGGVDGSKFALEAVRSGHMDICVSQMPYSQGIVSVLLAYHAVKYNAADELPDQLFFDTQSVTPANVKTYKSLWGDLPIGGAGIPKELKKILLH